MKKIYAVGIAVVLAVVILVAAGLSIANQSNPSTTSTTSLGSSTSSASSVATTSSGTTGQQGPSQFAVLATDPPISAAGVTHAYATYNGAAVHNAADSQSTGWVEMSASGTIDLVNSANVGQTVASAKVKGGTYDMVRLNITSAVVTYNNSNYTATVASGTTTAHMQDDAQVGGSASSAAVIDLRTFVINTGNTSKAQFTIAASGQATALPPSAVTSGSLEVGAKSDLQAQAWWKAFVDQTSSKVEVSSVTLTNTSLGLQAENSGNATAAIETVIVTPISSGGSANISLPGSLTGSAVFTVDGSGSLQASNSLQAAVLLLGSSAQLNSGASTSLSFSGAISLSFGLLAHLTGVVSGQQYLVTLMGPNTFASAVVVAQ